MWKAREYKLDEIGIDGMYKIESVPAISLESLSLYVEKEHTVYTSKSIQRCSLRLESKIAHGSYGNLYLAKRKGALEQNEQIILVKQPRMAEMNLTEEELENAVTETINEEVEGNTKETAE